MIAALFALLGSVALAQGEAELQQAADANFDAVMMQNEAQALGYVSGGNAAEAPPRPAPPVSDPAPATEGTVHLPLARYDALRALLEQSAAPAPQTGLVVLGSSSYSGEAVPGGLSLRLELQITLRGPGRWKTVPLIGEEVAVRSARSLNGPIALGHQSGYHVWVTDAVGEISLTLDLFVPARGPRGSLEYDFLVARTPITRFACHFDAAGLEPRLETAVRAEVTAGAQGTDLMAWLNPTSRIHLVGFKQQSESAGLTARLYAESLHLLSLSEDRADLFTVIRYNILQAGAQHFDIAIPPGWSLVSAEGAGGLRVTAEAPTAEGTRLRGETAFPIRSAYEISLRLERELPEPGAERLSLSPPQPLGAEREYGWMAVEAVGNLRVEEEDRSAIAAVEVRELPPEMVESAVSPILRAWRYHQPGARVSLLATPLPESKLASGSIDRLEASTVISPEGGSLTALRLVLRNRLRHSLALRLPGGMVVKSSRLDGEPFTPSRRDDGALLVPLRRSAGENRPRPFEIELLLAEQQPAFSLLGIRKPQLPTVELPVSAVDWELWAPANNRYSAPDGAVHNAAGPGAPALTVGSTLPRNGTALRYTRSHLAADQPLDVSFWFARGWLLLPLRLLAGLGLLALGAARGLATPRRLAGMVPLAGLLYLLGHRGWIVALPLLGLAGARLRELGVEGLRAAFSAAFDRSAEPAPGSWRAVGWGGKLLRLAVGLPLGLALLGALLDLLRTALRPVGG